MIPVSILTGFLGSGKTTLLNRLLREPAMNGTLVLVNEFGDVGIDHLLYDVVDQDIILLESGCICCSIKDDFTDALLKFIEYRDSGRVSDLCRVILETTGIADPLNILEVLLASRQLQTAFRPGGVLTVVDGVYGNRTLDEHFEAVQQAALADWLIVTKADIAQTSAIEPLRSRLGALNPRAGMVFSDPVNSPVIPADILDGSAFEPDLQPGFLAPGKSGLLRDQRPDRKPGGSGHDARFATFTISWQERVDWNDFLAWLEGLLFARGEDLFRIKGLVHTSSSRQPILVQAVQHSVYPPVELQRWPRGVALSQLVFITRDFTRTAAVNSLKPFLRTGNL